MFGTGSDLNLHNFQATKLSVTKTLAILRPDFLKNRNLTSENWSKLKIAMFEPGPNLNF